VSRTPPSDRLHPSNCDLSSSPLVSHQWRRASHTFVCITALRLSPGTCVIGYPLVAAPHRAVADALHSFHRVASMVAESGQVSHASQRCLEIVACCGEPLAAIENPQFLPRCAGPAKLARLWMYFEVTAVSKSRKGRLGSGRRRSVTETCFCLECSSALTQFNCAPSQLPSVARCGAFLRICVVARGRPGQGGGLNQCPAHMEEV
jgi:hypothetical protein